jgi:hypothetical protein
MTWRPPGARGRIDLKLLPAVSAREEVYFAGEYKRLNAVGDGHRRTLARDGLE